MASTRAQIIEERLKQAFNPLILTIEDESQQHAGHASAKESGGGHFKVTLVSALFQNKTSVARHKMVYEALEGLVGPTIHAIQITAQTPEEYQS